MNYEPKHYTYRVVWSEEDEEYVGLCAEFPLMSWLEEQPHAAYDGIVNLVAEVLKDMDTTGETPPEPLTMRKYSGDLRLRMPPELHRRLAMDAAEGRTSVNRLILQRIAWGDQPPSEPQPSLTLEAKAEHKPRKTTKADKRKLTA